MELSTAIALIRKGIRNESIEPQVWADLGAGSGLFSRALATLLPPASKIYAVDRDQASLNEIDWPYPDKTLIRVNADIQETLQLPMLEVSEAVTIEIDPAPGDPTVVDFPAARSPNADDGDHAP